MDENTEIEIDKNSKPVGNIGNYYGGLLYSKHNNRYYWGIEDWDGMSYEEIPKYLYDALNRFATSPENGNACDD